MPADVYASIQDALADAAAADALLAETGFRPARGHTGVPGGRRGFRRGPGGLRRRAPGTGRPGGTGRPRPGTCSSVRSAGAAASADDAGATRFFGAAPAPHAAPPAPRNAADPTQVLGAVPGGSGSAEPRTPRGSSEPGDVHPFGVAAVPPMQPPPPPMPAPGSVPGGGQVVAPGQRTPPQAPRRAARRGRCRGVVLVGVGAVTLLGSSSDDSKTNASGEGGRLRTVTAGRRRTVGGRIRTRPHRAAAANPEQVPQPHRTARRAVPPHCPPTRARDLSAQASGDAAGRRRRRPARSRGATASCLTPASSPARARDPGHLADLRERAVQARHEPPTAAELARYEGRTAHVLAYAEPGRRATPRWSSSTRPAPSRARQQRLATSGVLLETVVQVR
ncbi:hypothetical protein ACU686_22820 [Yinghuangia aomiensis]